MNAKPEIVVDNFAGGGGASTGIEQALGRPVDFAINHNAEAIAMHKVNHPQTKHFCESVWDVDPKKLARGRRVGLGWFSPDCTFHSKARGGKPFRDRNAARRQRGLAGLVPRWAAAVRPRVIMLENVEEFADWGPLLPDGRVDPIRRGQSFRKWHRQIENLGYQIDMRELRACDYGAPTTRKRLFVIARCDGEEIVFPEATHGTATDQAPFRTAAECIDWSLPCPSIFDRERPLAEATQRRIARGIMRYVVNNPRPYIVPITHTGGDRVQSIDEPLRTITTAQRGEFALISPTLIQTSWGERKGQAPRTLDLHKPLGTIVGGGIKHAVVAAFLARHYGGHENDGSNLHHPMHTVTTRDHHALIASHLVKFKGTSKDGQPLDEPLHTIQAGGMHYAEVRAFLMAYYGDDHVLGQALTAPMRAVRTKDALALVMVHGEPYAIADIGMRMLSAPELFRAQSFPADYIIDPEFNGKPLTKTAQVRMCGNSVPPAVARALVAANVVAA